MKNIILGFIGLSLSPLIMVISIKLIVISSGILSLIFIILTLFGLFIWLVALEVAFSKKGVFG